MNRIRLLILYTVVTLFLIAITATAGYFCLRQNIHVVNMKSNYATENLFAYIQNISKCFPESRSLQQRH